MNHEGRGARCEVRGTPTARNFESHGAGDNFLASKRSTPGRTSWLCASHLVPRTSHLTPRASRADARAGFTLIEMLVAISLLALLAIIAWRGFDQIAAQRVRVDADTAATDRVLRTLAQMERDLAQRIPDALIAGSYGAATLASALQVAVDESGRIRVSVLRAYPGTGQVRNVTYSLEESQLMRRLNETGDGQEIEALMMLDALQKFEIRLLVDGKWIEPRNLKEATPGTRAVAIEIAIERGGNERYLQVLQI